MTPSQLEQLRDFLADKTLSFGCRVIGTDENGYKREGMIGVDCGAYWIDSTDRNISLEFTLDKILGHTVTLSRVLWMMKQNNIYDYFIGPDGQFKGVDDTSVYWNLEKDDLMEQSPKTQAFLWNIFNP